MVNELKSLSHKAVKPTFSPAVPVEGLERFSLAAWSEEPTHHSYIEPDPVGEYVLFSQAEAVITALTARVKELEETIRDDVKFARTLETKLSAMTEQLKKVVAAWESLPGGRYYSIQVMQEWISGPMKKAIDNARAALDKLK